MEKLVRAKIISPDLRGAMGKGEEHMGLPADFLIGPDGVIFAAKYGAYVDDHWPVDDLLAIARIPPARSEHGVKGSLLDPPPTSWQNTWMIQLRDARQNELPSLSALCLRSKAVWGYDDAFMIACRTELTLVPDELKSTHVQVAERGTIVAGLAQVKVTDTDADLLKLFVEPALLRSGVGSLLFEWATARAKSLGAVRMVIEADPGAAPFYERMGARHAGFAPSQSIPGRVLPRMLLELDKPASTRPRVSS